jgi:hypothetical protein
VPTATAVIKPLPEPPRSWAGPAHSPADPQGAGAWGARVEPRQPTEKLAHGQPAESRPRRVSMLRASDQRAPASSTRTRECHCGRRRVPVSSIGQTRCRVQFASHLRVETAIGCGALRNSWRQFSRRLRKRSESSSRVDTAGQRSAAPWVYPARVRDSATDDFSLVNLPRERERQAVRRQRRQVGACAGKPLRQDRDGAASAGKCLEPLAPSSPAARTDSRERASRAPPSAHRSARHIGA